MRLEPPDQEVEAEHGQRIMVAVMLALSVLLPRHAREEDGAVAAPEPRVAEYAQRRG